jgi:hypothetical protein
VGLLATSKPVKFVLMRGKHEKRRAMLATFPILQPLHFHPFLHLLVTYSIYSFHLSRADIIVADSFRGKKKLHLLIHVKNDCKFLLPCLPDNEGKKGIDCICTLKRQLCNMEV